jgi:PAS domain S-box-containing protein
LSQPSAPQPTAPPHLRFRVPPEPSHLLRARERLRDYLRQYCAEPQVIDDVVLCVEEAATNAIRHSGSDRDIEIALHFTRTKLVATVKDRGRGFNLASFDREALPDVLSEHGRGLFIIAKLMDSFELRLDGGLEVRMARHVTPSCEPVLLEIGVGHNDARARATLEEIDEAFFALDWQYRHVYVNDMALRFTQKSREELLGRTPWDALPQLRGSLLMERYREAMELGKPSVFEHRSMVSGEWLEVRVYPTAAGISAYYREIGERKRIEQEVVATRAELAATLAAITDGFYTLDRRWRVTYLNDKAAEVFPGGKDALGADFWELFPGDVGGTYEDFKRRAMEQGEVCAFEFYYPPFDTWFEERDYPSSDGITVLFTDITERKLAEAERDQLMEAKNLLLEAATTAAAWTDLDRMLESLGDLLLHATDHSRIQLQVWDEERCEVEIAVSRGAAATPKRRFAFDGISDGAKEVITTKKTLVIDYAATSIPSLQKEYVDEHAFLLMLVVPILYRERLIGLITLDQPGQARQFTPREIELVEAIAAQAGAAIEHARLFDQAQETSAHLGDVFAGMTDGFVSVDHRWRYTQVNPRAEELIGRSALELLGRSMEELFPDMEGWPHYRKAMLERSAETFEVWSKPLETWLEVHACPTADGMSILFSDITARKAAENALRDSERLLRLAQEAAGFGVCDYDLRAGTAVWDKRLREIMGVACDEPLTGEALLAGVHPDDLGLAEAAFAKAIDPEGDGAYGASHRIVRASDGEERWVRAIGQASFVDGVATRLTGTVEDITQERRAAEEERSRSEALVTLLAHMSDGVLMLDRQWRYTFVNDRTLELTGKRKEELVGRVIWDVFPAICGTDFEHALREAMREHRSLTVEVPSIVRHGWHEVGIHPTADGLALFWHDVTERKKAEVALRDSEERFRSLFESTTEGIALHEVIYDDGGRAIDYRIMDVNPSFESQTGMLAQDARGRLASELYGTGEAPYLSEYARVAVGEGPLRFETYFAPMERHFRITVVSPGRGRFATVFEDITERKRAEEERQRILEDSQAQAEELQSQSEELRLQGDELQAQFDEQLLQRAALLRENELRAGLNVIGELLHSTLEPDEVMRRALGEAARALAIDAAAIELREADSWPVRYAEGLPADALGSPLTGEPVISRLIACSGEALVLDDVANHEAVGPFAARYGIRSLMAVPLVAREKVVGTLLLVERRAARPFEPAEVDFANRLGTMAGLALENGRLFKAQRTIAQTLQENFIHPLPVVAGLELGVVAKTAYEPERVGGDFSDVFVVDDTHVVVLIGDVAGKGVRAAGLTETVRSTVRALATIDPSPAFILAKTNELLLRFDPDEPHVTALCVVLDPHTGHLSFASAGHPAPVHLGASTCQALDVVFGTPLGSFERPYPNSHVMLPLKDYLVLYTDGVTEARRDGELLGEHRLLEIVSGLRGRSAQEVAEGVFDAASDFADGRLKDDLQVVVLRLA